MCRQNRTEMEGITGDRGSLCRHVNLERDADVKADVLGGAADADIAVAEGLCGV